MNTPIQAVDFDKVDIALEGLTNIDRFLSKIPEDQGIDKYTASAILAHTQACANDLGLDVKIDKDVSLSLEAFKIDAKAAVIAAYEYVRDIVKKLIAWVLKKFGKKTKRKPSDNLKDAEKKAKKAKEKAKENIKDIREVSPDIADELETVVKQAEAAKLNGMSASEFAVAEQALIKRYGKPPKTIKSAVFTKPGTIASSYAPKTKTEIKNAVDLSWPPKDDDPRYQTEPRKESETDKLLKQMIAEVEERLIERAEVKKKRAAELEASRKANEDAAKKEAEEALRKAQEKEAAAQAHKDALAAARKKVAEVVDYIYSIDKQTGVLLSPIKHETWHIVADKEGYVLLDPAFKNGPLDLDGFYEFMLNKANSIAKALVSTDLENQFTNFAKSYEAYISKWRNTITLAGMSDDIKALQENTLLLKLANKAVGVPGLTATVVPNKVDSDKGYYVLDPAYKSNILQRAAVADYNEVIICKDPDISRVKVKGMIAKYDSELNKLEALKIKLAKRYSSLKKGIPKVPSIMPNNQLDWVYHTRFFDQMVYPGKWAMDVLRYQIHAIEQVQQIYDTLNNLSVEIGNKAS